MKDNNIVLLEGRIGEDYKYGKTQDGKEFATFSLVIAATNHEYKDQDELNRPTTYVRVFAFDKRQIEYLRKVKARSGYRASVFGRLNSSHTEHKGISIMSNNVVVRDIHIIKTQE